MPKLCSMCKKFVGDPLFSKLNSTCNPCLQKVRRRQDIKKSIEKDKKNNKGIIFFEEFFNKKGLENDFSNRKI